MTKMRFKRCLVDAEKLPLEKEQNEIINNLEDEIYKTYETCETKIHSNFDTEEDKARPKIGPKSYWKESPVKKEIEENWQ